MMVYLLKVIICSGLLLLAYKALLEQETCHQFKRIFLILALLVSVITPLLEIDSPVKSLSILNEQLEDRWPLTTSPGNHPSPANSGTSIGAAQPTHASPANEIKSYDLSELLLWAYFIITAFIFVLRFCVGLWQIIAKTGQYPRIRKHKSILVLTDEDEVPHSFFHFVFVGRLAFQNGEIATEIIQHEEYHGSQKHSLDLLLVELLQAMLWINPFLPLYKKAIKLNHEFLADQHVIGLHHDVPAYQLQLLHLSIPAAAVGFR